MQEKLTVELTQEISARLALDPRQTCAVQRIIAARLSEYTLAVCDDKSTYADNAQLLNSFVSSKRIEGCSDKTINYYKNTISMLFTGVQKPLAAMSTDDIRLYLDTYRTKNGSSRVTIDNIRRILSSFFSWLEDEDYIIKSPVRRIHRVKTGRTVKEAFSDEAIEKLIDACESLRDLTIVELLLTTGMRVGELVLLDKSDINFDERSVIVFGKGDAEREVYFDARTKLHLLEYISSRTDDCPALFVSKNKPHRRLSISGTEDVLKRIGARAGVSGVHPHKFRRTLATTAIDKGMPIEQVQRLLGHVRIDTTMHYALVSQSNVKLAHRRYLS